LVVVTFDEVDSADPAEESVARCGEQPLSGATLAAGGNSAGGGRIGTVLLSPFSTPGPCPIVHTAITACCVRSRTHLALAISRAPTTRRLPASAAMCFSGPMGAETAALQGDSSGKCWRLFAGGPWRIIGSQSPLLQRLKYRVPSRLGSSLDPPDLSSLAMFSAKNFVAHASNQHTARRSSPRVFCSKQDELLHLPSHETSRPTSAPAGSGRRSGR
jgi:hypothetical protein